MGCGELAAPNFGRIVSGAGDAVGARIRFACTSGYELATDPIRTCQASLQWTGEPARCTPVDCGPLPRPSNGQVSFSDTTFEAVATYSCSVGFVRVGPVRRTCQASGLWGEERPACLVASPTASDLLQIRIVFDGDYASLTANVALFTRFSADIITQIAAFLEVPQQRLVLLSVADGSIAVVIGVRRVSGSDVALLGPDADTLAAVLEDLVDAARVVIDVTNGPIYTAIANSLRIVDILSSGDEDGEEGSGAGGTSSNDGEEDLSAGATVAVVIAVVCALLLGVVLVAYLRERSSRRGQIAINPLGAMRTTARANPLHGGPGKRDGPALSPQKRDSVLLDMILAPTSRPQTSGAWGAFDANVSVDNHTVQPASPAGGNFFSADLSEDNFSPASYVGRQRLQRGRVYLPMQAGDVGETTFVSGYEDASIVSPSRSMMGMDSSMLVGNSLLEPVLHALPGEPIVHNSTALSVQAMLHYKDVGSFLFWSTQDALVLSVTEPSRVRHIPVARLGSMYVLAHKKEMPPFASLGELVRFFQAHPYDRGLSLRQEEQLESVF